MKICEETEKSYKCTKCRDMTFILVENEALPCECRALREAEDILMDEMPILPIYYYTTVTAANENVKGVRISTLGKISFKYAYKE